VHRHSHAVALRKIADPLVFQNSARGKDIRMDHRNRPGLQQRFPEYTHRLMHIFLAEIVSEEAQPTEQDMGMEKSEWIPFECVQSLPELCPHVLQARLFEVLSGENAVFLGTELNDWSDA